MVVRVAAGGFHCGAVSEQGLVYAWGENTGGQCGLAERGAEKTITGTLSWIWTFLFISTAWTSQSFGLFPLPVPEPSPVSVVDHDVTPPAAVRVADLAFGREHSLALSAQKEVWAWGSGCQLGLVTTTFPVWRPQKVSLWNQRLESDSVQVCMLQHADFGLCCRWSI